MASATISAGTNPIIQAEIMDEFRNNPEVQKAMEELRNNPEAMKAIQDQLDQNPELQA